MRDIGLHLRLTDTFAQLAAKAERLELSIFQCFFLQQDSLRFAKSTADDRLAFRALRKQFKQLFVHAAYWTNFASIKEISLHMFKREVALTKELEFNQIIIHAGSAKGASDKQQGIDALAHRLNRLLKHEHDITIVLENSAHGNLSIGGDLHDYAYLLQRIDYPEKIAFCIDTAHAHVQGYHISDISGQLDFFKTIDTTIGFDRIALIHLNNTDQAVGSCIDKHVLLDQGVMSLEALKHFMLYEKLIRVPVIMELPVVDEEVEKRIVQLVRSWH